MEVERDEVRKREKMRVVGTQKGPAERQYKDQHRSYSTAVE